MWIATEEIKGRKFIGSKTEQEIGRICDVLGLRFLPRKSATTKAAEINAFRKGKEEVIYYLRHEGVASGSLRVVVSPKIGVDVDRDVLKFDGISAHTVRRDEGNPRFLYNANFLKYKNKHDRGGDKEHYGWAYRIDVNNGLENFECFLRAFTS